MKSLDELFQKTSRFLIYIDEYNDIIKLAPLKSRAL